MIKYEKSAGGLGLLLRAYGSAWPRAIPLAVPGAILAGILEYYCNDSITNLFHHPLPFSYFASIVAFLLVFRTNLSHQRYWEGRTQIAYMSSKWTAAASEVVAFDEAAVGDAALGGPQFQAEFVHLMSLLHGLAIQSLRGDDVLDNLVRGSFDTTPVPPPEDPAELPNWKKYSHLCALRQEMRHFRQYWLHLPLPVIGGLSFAELAVLKDSEERPYCAFHWVQQRIVTRHKEGGVAEDAPIVSRLFANLDDGYSAYEQALKISETPFPFPYAQTVTILLQLFGLSVPFIMVAYMDTVEAVTVFTLLSIMCYQVLNEVAREIEDPFKWDPNDVPVAFLHHRFNVMLLNALHKKHGDICEHIDVNDLDGASMSPSRAYYGPGIKRRPDATIWSGRQLASPPTPRSPSRPSSPRSQVRQVPMHARQREQEGPANGLLDEDTIVIDT